MAVVDFEQEFSRFVASADSSAIKDIYNIIPSLNNTQMKILNSLKYYIEKYDMEELRQFLMEYEKMILKNKNLNFVSSMNAKTLLKAYTQEELIKGIKINTSGRQDE